MSHVESDPASDAMADTGQGVGARLLRKEDDRFMRGRGQYVADIRLAGLQDVAFVRSPLAHARIRAIHVPERYRDVVFTAADLTGVKPIRAVSGLARLQDIGTAGARHRQSASRRRTRRDVRGADAGGSRGYRGCGDVGP